MNRLLQCFTLFLPCRSHSHTGVYQAHTALTSLTNFAIMLVQSTNVYCPATVCRALYLATIILM
jgi:hypothetical protein